MLTVYEILYQYYATSRREVTHLLDRVPASDRPEAPGLAPLVCKRCAVRGGSPRRVPCPEDDQVLRTA